MTPCARSLLRWASLCALAWCAAGCRELEDPLQTIVLIEAEAGVREAIAAGKGEVSVSSGSDKALLHTVALPPENGWPIKLVLAPKNGDAGRRFSVTFSAENPGSSDQALFGFEVSAGFVAGRSRTLRLQIQNSCVEPASACRVGCAPLEIDADALRASADLELPITCQQDGEPAMNVPGNTEGGTGGAEPSVAGNGMINVGTNAGRGGAAGSLPAAGSGGRAQPSGGRSAQPQAGSGGGPGSVDPCAAVACGDHGTCTAAGSCECEPGYASAAAGQPCADIDECSAEPQRCGGGKCQNLPGDFACECAGETWPKPDKHSCGRILPAESLTPSYSSAVPCQPQIAFFGASAGKPGKGLAVWITGDSTQSLWSASFDPDSGWTIATLPITAGVSGLDTPRLALNPTTGDGFVVWLQSTSGQSEVRYAVRRNGRFGAPGTLATPTGRIAEFLTAALSASGDGYASWTELGGDATSVRSQVVVSRFLGRTTQTWVGNYVLAGADGADNAAISRVGVDGQGRATVVWSAAAVTDSGTPNIIGKAYAARYDVSATTPFWRPLGDLDSLGSGLADVAFEPGGKGIGIWQRGAPMTSGLSVAASVFTPGEGWGTTAVLSAASDPTFMLPRVAMMPGGSGFAMWIQQAASALNVWGSMYDPGTNKWSSPAVPLSSQSSTPPPTMSGWVAIYFDLIDLAVDETGGGLGVFSDFSGTSRTIRAVHVRADTHEISSAIEVKRDSTPLKPSRVEVGLDSQGSGALIWDQPLTAMPASYKVFVSRVQ